jgi:GT2 family glycosyltransferase/glycosyltransferase involved in cell wall biosynthesis
MGQQETTTPEERLKAAQQRIRQLEIEVQSLHTRLHQITTSRVWAFITFFHRVHYWLWKGPADERREKIRGFATRTCKKAGIYPAARWAWRLSRQIKHNVLRPGWQATTKVLASDGPHGYDVICLPVMLLHSRFQRPQQLMDQYAKHGHRVFYASMGFCGGKTARVVRQWRNMYEMMLPGPADVNVFKSLPTEQEVLRMADSIDRFRAKARIASAVVVVQLPFWTLLAEELRKRHGWSIVYDCMDDHAGFSTHCDAVLRMEERTIADSDLVVTTSNLLDAKVQPTARRTALIRNACEHEHFAAVADLAPAAKRKGTPGTKQTVVGFYGAISTWFDSDLVAELAESRPDWKFELIGSSQTADTSRLKRLPNVKLFGEKPYAELPKLIAGWDCFIIPFKRIPLTEATNPVKAYEMLATGKPVVSVDLPELRLMARDGLLSLAHDSLAFAEAIERELAEDNEAHRASRRAFAAQNTWRDRYEAFDSAVRETFPLASIIIVTYNNLGLTQMCLESIFRETDYPNYEVIVVDNASHDGTAEWLDEESLHEPRLRVICNADNRGFSAANNQGLRISRGEYLCLLNNDTVVTRNWLSTLIGHLRTPKVGMVGPVSNMVGNEAKVPVDYTAIADMPRWAADYCRRHDGETLPMKMLGFFCVALRREVFEKVGEMDEQFGVGYFEDTDYCYRTGRAGYELRCARDAFVHHWQGASFRLLGNESHAHIYKHNQQLFESKWGADSMAGAY